MKNSIAIIVVLFLIAGQSLRAQETSSPKTLTLAQQQEDFKIFRGSLNEMHVGLNWFISEKDLNDLFDGTYESLSENAPVEDYYLKLRRIMASIRHGHSDIALPQESGVSYRLSLLSKSKKFFPLAIRILDKRVFVAVNTSANDKMTVGTEILSINGEPVGKILEKQLPLMFANGRNTSFKYARLDGYYQFHYLYELTNPRVERFVVEAISYRSRKKQRFQVEGEAPAAIAERFEKITGKGISDYGQLLKYQVLDDENKIAYLKIASFYSGRVKNYADFLDQTFTSIKQSGIKHLIVDVRGNEGGGDGFWQMAYVYTTGNALTDAKGFPFVKGDVFSYLKYVENPSPDVSAFIADPNAFVDKSADGHFRLEPQYTAEDTQPYVAPPNAFTGKLYILQDGLTFSAGTLYVKSVYEHLRQRNQFVKFIGDEPGDDLNAGVVSAGTAADIVLPNSKIKIKIPLVGSGEKAYGVKERIIIPDYKIIPAAKDLVGGTDPELRFTTDLIRKKYASLSRSCLKIVP